MRRRGVAKKVEFQFEEPKEGQLTLGFVLHILRIDQIKKLLPDAKIIGYVVSKSDEKRGRR